MYNELLKDLDSKLSKVTDDIIMLRNVGYIPNAKKYIQLSWGLFITKVFTNSDLFTDDQLRNINRIYNKLFGL